MILNYTKTLTLTKSGYASVAKIALELASQNKSSVIVVNSYEELRSLKSYLNLFSPDLSSSGLLENNSFFQDPKNKQFVSLGHFNQRSQNKESWGEKLSALYSLTYGQAKILILTLDNLLHYFPPITFFNEHELNLVQGENISEEMIISQLISWGYERVSMLANVGEMSKRGDILDIFPPGYDYPIRLDFFGDYLEEIRVYNPNNQRSIRTIPKLCILPVSHIQNYEQAVKKMSERWNRLFQKKIISEQEEKSLLKALNKNDLRLLPASCYDAKTILTNWLPKDTTWILPGKNNFADALTESHNSWQDILKDDAEDYLIQNPKLVLRKVDEILTELSASNQVIYLEPLIMGSIDNSQSLQERNIHSFEELFNLPDEEDRPWKRLIAKLKEWQKSKRQVILAFNNERSRTKFLNLIEANELVPFLRYHPNEAGLFALVAPLTGGLDLVWDNSIIISDEILQPRQEKNKRAASKAFKGLDNYDELASGDLLVHKDYGVGRFRGLEKLETRGILNDYILLEYADEAKLFVPVDRLGLIGRFQAGDGPTALDKLGGSGWKVSKDKVRKAIEKIAADLVQMYAWRKVAKGFKYSPLGELYKEFEASFAFEETPDQAKAIQEVLEDMEKPEPMDRLVCGDVGFGKTEVALRAAFRAACDGRQVALLCPTTILAEQHFQTFRSRLSAFPINVALLSRFVSRPKQIDTLRAAAQGQVDILIGTHRLLSEDVKLPNLALMILDEEQRFGVRHKEKLKNLKKNVDVLTLTATPIPRTLQLSMSGIRELSVIETAPPERKAVATALIEREKSSLKNILEKEIAREGQVFWVYNRVLGLEKVAALARELVPNARIGMAHGQMSEKELEDTMHKFWHAELDILVCTSIVESGLDFPRANTLIVDGAQMFGLGQLYQLRGRVGRSDIQAYAYFVVQDTRKLTEIAQERLRIILELDYLGAGFQLAMEDLRIRGAGNILGEVQTGHIGRIGLEMYLEMLEEEVSKLKGEVKNIYTETELNIAIAAYIPDNYIADSKERLKYYKLLSSENNSAKMQEVLEEIIDRFGKLPLEFKNFIAILNFKSFLTAIEVVKADIFNDKLKLTWTNQQKTINYDKLIAFVKNPKNEAKLLPPASLEIKFDSKIDKQEILLSIQEKITQMQ